MKGFVLGGTSSGVGKTVATLATIRALASASREVQPAKAGPDFIDPSHHERVAGRPSRTLDLWLQGVEGLRRNYARGEGDVCVVEGVMGCYDGDCSSTAAVAAALDLPVVLVVDAKAGMESVAATALGFQRYAEHLGGTDRSDDVETPAGDADAADTPAGHSSAADLEADVEIAGVLAQRAHGGRHEAGIRDALPEDLTYFGRIPPSDDLEIPDRHLGLEMGQEAPLADDALDAAAEHLRVDRLLEIAQEPPKPAPDLRNRTPSGHCVAVARDAAFCFTYPATIERLRERATVEAFSPVAGDDLPDCDAVYLPGGYPELHAAELAAGGTLDAIADRAAEGLPVFGECGGLLALSETLTTVEGESHAMAGVLPADVELSERYQALDHVELRARDDALTAAAGETLRGHEFHYSSADVASDARFAFDVVRGDGIEDGREGLTEHRTLGTYCHVHPESGAFDAFLEGI